MSKKKLIIFAVVVLAVVGGLVAALTMRNPATNTSKQVDGPSVDQATVDKTTSIEVSYQGEEGKNALDLLKAKHAVETKNSAGLGEFVTSIDTRASDEKHFWAFYVNGKQAEVGAGSYVTKSSDIITWKLEEIK